MIAPFKNWARMLRNTYVGAPTNSRAFMHDGPAPKQPEDMGPIEQLFWSTQGAAVDKWHQYLPVYDRHFAPYLGRAPRFLEIGVQNGGSLALWRRFFGPEATIFGIDINPDCAQLDGKDGSVRIGSQADPGFLRDVIDEMGGVDIVLDDGSHMMTHVNASFRVLFPLLADQGIYMVEDMQCAYWSAFGGAKRRRETFVRTAMSLVDDMHHWYSQVPIDHPGLAENVSGVHFYDAILVIDKAPLTQPARTMIGDKRDIFGAGLEGFQARATSDTQKEDAG
ncbi:MAG: class I SAM-dependent methyltransferase [Pseudomonadota bacterium]